MNASAKRKTSPGVTLIELLVAITVLAIIVTAAVPSFQDFIRNNRVTSQSNELSSIVSFARSEAATREQGTRIVRPPSADCANAWCIQVVDQTCPATCILRETGFDNVSLQVVSGALPMEFNNRGVLDTGEVTLELKHQPCSGDRQRKELRVLISGAVRAETTACGGS